MLTIDAERERNARAELQELMLLADVRRLLNVSWYRMLAIARSGELPVYNISGEPVEREYIPSDFKGLRCLPTEVRDYIQNIRV